jgi:hypothetical protein
VAYELEAILGPQAVLARHRDRYRSACVVPLEHGWAIVPLTFDVRRELGRVSGPGVWDASDAGRDFQRRLSAWLEEISQDDVVAYIESECFGNECADAATVWRDGGIVLGPVSGRSGDLVINKALRFMGVSRGSAKAGGILDEFDTVGLNRHRKTEQWVESPNQQAEVWKSVPGPPPSERLSPALRRLFGLLPGSAGKEADQKRAVERDGNWVLPLAGAKVTQYRLAHSLYRLIMLKPRIVVEVRIEGPFLLSCPGQADLLLHPSAGEETLHPAFALLGLAVREGVAYSGGRLTVHFKDGSELSAEPGDECEAWEVTSSWGLRIVAPPGGGLAVWSERAEADS